jgi:hypothetical protein
MSDEWIKTLANRRRVKFTNQELDQNAFLIAQVEGNKVVYSIMLTNAKTRLVMKKLKLISRASFQSGRRNRIEPSPSFDLSRNECLPSALIPFAAPHPQERRVRQVPSSPVTSEG